MTSVWIYINTNVPVGDREHVKAFADQDTADKWFERHDPEGALAEPSAKGNDIHVTI